MKYREIAEKCLALAKDRFDEAQVYVQTSKSIGIDYYNENLDSYEITDDCGLSLEVRKGDKWASTYTEKITEDALEDLLNAVTESLEVSEENANKSFYQAKEDEEIAVLPDRKKISIDTEKMLTVAKELASAILSAHDHVQMASSSISVSENASLLLNTHGLDREQEGQVAYVRAYVVLNVNDDRKTGFSFRVIRDLEDLPLETLAREAVQDAADAYGAKSIQAGKYKVVLDKDVVSALLRSFVSTFSANTVQQGLSLFAGKVGEVIANEKFTLVDDPLFAEGLQCQQFDGEGVPTKALPLIQYGTLKNFLYDLETAKKDGVESTANAKRSYKSSPSPGVSTLVVEKGEKDFDALLEHVGDGLLITQLQGLHSGLNAISGDFSLPALGFVIKDGKKGRAVNQITVAGNLKDLLLAIEEVGADAALTIRSTYNPSIVIREMSVSGEA